MDQKASEVIRGGNADALNSILKTDPTAVHSRVDGKRTLLHVATDWPGHFPNVRNTIKVLVAHGADVNAKVLGMPHSETALHWAASSDDVEAIDALLDSGADIEAPGAVIGGGTPLADAVAFGTWNAARRLVERGAKCTIWQAAALGLMERLEAFWTADAKPTKEEVTNAFWGACHGGQLAAAQYLLSHGAELNWVGHDHLTPLGAAVRNGDRELVGWLREQGAV